jgi:hypothetical protein
MRADVVATLNGLIETCRVGESGYRDRAQQVRSPALAATLRARAEECGVAASQLISQLEVFGGRAPGGRAPHPGGFDDATAPSGAGDLVVLEECERGEDAALESYLQALQRGLPAPVQQLVERQLEGVRRNHDDIRRMRDAMRMLA